MEIDNSIIHQYIDSLPKYIKGPFFDFKPDWDKVTFKFRHENEEYAVTLFVNNFSYNIQHRCSTSKYCMGKVYFRK